MDIPDLVTPEFVSLKKHPILNEKWLQERLIDNPSLLGLGDLSVISSERIQPSGGRLDLLLRDEDTLTRYEVEIQLGAVDESHIIRTIEYWDIERRRYPQYEHRAVIVAEDVTSRFLNVISLLNGAIPLIAIQLKGVKVNHAFTLIATRVVDLATLGTEEEDEGDPVDRAYWERLVSQPSLSIMDDIIKMAEDVQSGLNTKYNKGYISLASSNGARRFLTLGPRKKPYVLTDWYFELDKDITDQLDNAGIKYDTQLGRYRLWVYQNDVKQHGDMLRGFIDKSLKASVVQ